MKRSDKKPAARSGQSSSASGHFFTAKEASPDRRGGQYPKEGIRVAFFEGMLGIQPQRAFQVAESFAAVAKLQIVRGQILAQAWIPQIAREPASA